MTEHEDRLADWLTDRPNDGLTDVQPKCDYKFNHSLKSYEQRLMVYEKRVTRIFQTKRDEASVN